MTAHVVALKHLECETCSGRRVRLAVAQTRLGCAMYETRARTTTEDVSEEANVSVGSCEGYRNFTAFGV